VDLSRIPAQPEPGLINVLVEIPAGSKNKYEFDKDMQAFILDRVLFASVQYPYDYGFIPNTLADDGDPSRRHGDDGSTPPSRVASSLPAPSVCWK
jgi:inorganic pyrophosphatase